MGSANQYNQTWNNPNSHPNPHPSATNEIQTPSHPLATQQPGAYPPLHQPRIADTVSPTIHGHIQHTQFSPTSPTHAKVSQSHTPGHHAASHDPIRGHQPLVVPSTVSRHTENLEQRPHASNHQLGRGEQQFPPPPGQQPNSYSSGRRAPDAGSKKCRIPDCTYDAYHDYFEQEMSDYCGRGHELQAVTTGLVDSCIMCKERPRRTGERVCGRTCREQYLQARPVQGQYYGVPVVRHEPRARQP